MTYGVRNPGSVSVLNRLIDPNPNPLIIRISTTMQMQTIKTKPAEIRFHSKRPHTVTTMSKNINIYSTIAGLVNVRS